MEARLYQGVVEVSEKGRQELLDWALKHRHNRRGYVQWVAFLHGKHLSRTDAILAHSYECGGELNELCTSTCALSFYCPYGPKKWQAKSMEGPKNGSNESAPYGTTTQSNSCVIQQSGVVR